MARVQSPPPLLVVPTWVPTGSPLPSPDLHSRRCPHDIHPKLGISCVAGLFAQFAGGVARAHAPPPGTPKSAVRVAWEWAHFWTGRLLIVFIAVTVFWGPVSLDSSTQGPDTTHSFARWTQIPETFFWTRNQVLEHHRFTMAFMRAGSALYTAILANLA